MTDGSAIPPSNRSPLKLAFLTPPAGYYAIFFIAPLAFLVVLGFWIVRDYQIVAEFSVGNYVDIFSQFFSRSRFGWALIQSVYIAVTTSVFAVIFCYFLAMGIVFCIA